MMRRLLPISCCLLLLGGCKAPEESGVKAIVGAILIDGTGGPPISDSVITVEGSRIRAVGSRTSLPVPAAADKIDGSGKFLVPGLIDLDARLNTAAGRPGIRESLDRYLRSGVTSLRSTADGPDILALRQQEREGALVSARLFAAGRAESPRQVEKLAAAHVDAIEIGVDQPAIVERILDESRNYRIPVIAGAFTLAGARVAVDNGAASLLQMVRDTETIDPAFISRLRDLRIVFAPALARLDPSQLAIAKRNTKRLAEGGVLIGLASGDDTFREMDLLADCGLSPADVLLAATRNGAAALRQLDQLGTLEPGKRADLLLLSANPAEDIRNVQKIDRVMLDGHWIERER
jgi:imidazolonepropionase-like amidohydrolase